MAEQDGVRGGIVICNHWTQFGIGETFPEGEIGGRWYRRTFSTVYGFETGRRWLASDPRNRVCHEFDAYCLDAVAAEAPEYVATLRDMLDSRRMELPGGTYGQAESQVFGYESALRQLTCGQAAYRRHLQRPADTYLVEEQSFFPQLPQLLRLAGFRYASIQFQNSGTPDALPHDVILWESPDGTAIPTIPNHPGLSSCVNQWKHYDDAAAQLAGHEAPLLFQWMELWPPGNDWGASIAPYEEAIRALEAKGWRQMLLTEYIEWALARCETPRVRIPLDRSNYNNNFFQGGWGYENERTARGSNQCESLLMAADTLCAGGGARGMAKSLRPHLRDLWGRLLVSQNHDPYLAGSLPAYIDGLRTFMSELAVKQFADVRRAVSGQAQIDHPLPGPCTFRLFNPCAWDVHAPVLLELNQTDWPACAYTLNDGDVASQLSPLFRADNGNVLIGPAAVRMKPYETRDVELTPCDAAPMNGRPLLTPMRDGQVWEAGLPCFEGVSFEPLVGEWRQLPTYWKDLPVNRNVEMEYPRIEAAPVTLPLCRTSNGMDAAAWRMDLMRIKSVEEPALSVHGLVMAGETCAPFVAFEQRLAGPVRFETGPRPNGTWRFRLRIPGPDPVVVADAPFSEERRTTEFFYCARYVRLEWPGRHLLWCPSQNTLFRRMRDGDVAVFECTVFDFAFSGTANWGMRFFARPQFTPAESMRLAEGFHRRPMPVPLNVTAGRATGIAAHGENIVITHVFPGEDGSIAVRALNASDEPCRTTFEFSRRLREVRVADLDGAAGDGPPLAHHAKRWGCDFRPWQIATFTVK